MKISNDMFDENNKKVVSPSTLNRNPNEDVNLESDTLPKQNISDMEKWKKIAAIIIAVIVVVVGGVVIKSVITPSDSDALKTTVSSSNKTSTTETNKNAIKEKASDSSIPSSTKESPVSSSEKSETYDSTTQNSSSENFSDSLNEGDAGVINIQQRIQSSLPDLTVGDTHLQINTDVVVHSVKTTNGVETTLTANGKPFAIITTKDGVDSIKLLSGYQAFASEIKTQK